MDLGLRGKVALITTSNKGIDFGIARVFAEEGARVMISSRNRENVERAVSTFIELSGERFLGSQRI